MYLTPKPRSQWKGTFRRPSSSSCSTARRVRRPPGQRLAHSQPIEVAYRRNNTGVRSDWGDAVWRRSSRARQRPRKSKQLRSSQGAPTSTPSRLLASRCCKSKSIRDQLARYGVAAQTVLDLVESTRQAFGEIVEGSCDFNSVARLLEAYRASPEAPGSMLISTPAGRTGLKPPPYWRPMITVEGPSTTREWGQRRITITSNICAATWRACRRRAQRQTQSRHAPVATALNNGANSKRCATGAYRAVDRRAGGAR